MTETLSKLLAELSAADGTQPAPAHASPRERVAQAALELFADRSYEGTTTKAIAERAGVTERTLFKHFPSKEELFARSVFPALLQALSPITIQPVAHLLDAHADNLEAAVRMLVADRVAFGVHHPAIVTMAVRESLLRPDFRTAVVTLFNQRMRPHLETLLEQARALNQIRDLPTDVVIRAIVGQISAYLVARLLFAPDKQWDDALEVERIVALIMRGIGAAEHLADQEAAAHGEKAID